ncbi:MAG: sigma-70 family RNA polymerase sigma factor [Acidobacteria bacterium]|nr:sigma-70 family RNA polymerase sigma factor [Acidobacteriota bacterium]
MERTREVFLVARARSGDPDAFSELVRAHSPRLMRMALRVVKEPADAEEVVQDALWKAFRSLHGYRQDCALSTWLTRITINRGIMRLRQRKNEPIGLEDIYLQTRRKYSDLLPAAEKTPEEICIAAETEGILRQSLNRIHPTHRAALCLRELDELSYEEIAQQLCLPLSTVRIRIHRGRRQLRMILARRLARRCEPASSRIN